MLVKSKYDFDKLEQFLERIKADVYPEPLANEDFIESGFESIKDKIKSGQKVLDVGCGHGYAMDIFSKHHIDIKGITLSEEDKKIALSRGHNVQIMDMSFLEFEDECFDGIWARQCLEHSIFPYYTLSEFYRVLKFGGWIYVEVPASDTGCHHECNGNHYSVLPLSMWGNLLHRIGFNELKPYEIKFKLIPPYNGNDLYYRIIGQK